ncbi:hypothetical protein [Dinoroseobacter sp. S124A]|uniref:hypothetical protein n=1 Tax=Dinoroseobacter sp. S124A TaxID=3415128 RepID=UPI003C7ADE94
MTTTTDKTMDAEALAALKKLQAAVVEDSDRWSGHDVFVGFGQHKQRDFLKAKGGSLDAAKALHDAVLPGWGWRFHERYGDGVTKESEAKRAWVSRPHSWRVGHTADVVDDNAARAWLTAIIKALIWEAEQ